MSSCIALSLLSSNRKPDAIISSRRSSSCHRVDTPLVASQVDIACPRYLVNTVSRPILISKELCEPVPATSKSAMHASKDDRNTRKTRDWTISSWFEINVSRSGGQYSWRVSNTDYREGILTLVDVSFNLYDRFCLRDAQSEG